MRTALAQLGVAIVVGAVITASPAAGEGGNRHGVLEFRGGIKAQTNINPSTCTAGPGDAIAISLLNVGGWQSLYLTASTPLPGKHGVAKVALQGTGKQDNAYAIAVWSWTKAESVRSSGPVRISANGASGTINVKLPLASVDDVSSIPPVAIALHWTPGTCART
jgi:hypothetical protein